MIELLDTYPEHTRKALDRLSLSTRAKLEHLLDLYKAKPVSEPKEWGNFLTIKTQDFQLPNGKQITREYIDKNKATVIVPVTIDDSIVFVIQPIALSKEGSLVEVPAGYVETKKGEGEWEGGVRELAEETGYVPVKIEYLGEHYQDPGCIRQTVDTFLALWCEKKVEQQLDADEYITSIEIPMSEAFDLLDSWYIKDANTYIALSKFYRWYNAKD